MRFKVSTFSGRFTRETNIKHSAQLECSRNTSTIKACCGRRVISTLRPEGRLARSCLPSQKHSAQCPFLLSSKLSCPSRRLHAVRFTAASMSISSMDEYSEDRERPRLGFAHSQELSSPSFELWALSAERSLAETHPVEFLSEQLVCSGWKEVFVILFGIGKRESEGLYSLRVGSDNGLPQETIVAFEAKEDADRYAMLLEAAMYFMPNVCSISREKLIRFCSDSGYNCRFEPKGSLLRPPCYTVGVTDWEKSLRLRAGYWSVLEEEPDRWYTHGESEGLFSQDSSSDSNYMQLSEEQLEAIKAKLETLLPPE